MTKPHITWTTALKIYIAFLENPSIKNDRELSSEVKEELEKMATLADKYIDAVNSGLIVE